MACPAAATPPPTDGELLCFVPFFSLLFCVYIKLAQIIVPLIAQFGAPQLTHH